jgi:hypothetical protein
MTQISRREALRLPSDDEIRGLMAARNAAKLWRARLARSLACALIALATLAQSPASGQEIVGAPAPMTEAQAAVVDQARGFIRKWLADNNIPGVSVAVGVNGRIVWAEGFGWADLEQQVPVTQITRFRIGSVSKPLTAAHVAAVVVARGRRSLREPGWRARPRDVATGAPGRCADLRERRRNVRAELARRGRK